MTCRALTSVAASVAIGMPLLAADAAVADAGPLRAAGPVGAPIRWAACDPPGERLQCARIRVPLDWDRPRGRTITLAVIRHLASKPAERIGTMFANPGGPGDTGVGLVRGDPDGLDALGGGRFDVVSWDPRGTHASTRVHCFRDRRSEEQFWAGAAFPRTRAEAGRVQRRGAALARRCGQVSGWLLPHISTADTARDMDHLRVLVGDPKLTYLGLSYGSFLGQTYANLFPTRVRAMLLNGIVDATRYAKSAEARTEAFADSADEVFRRFLVLCERAGPQRCALAGGGLSPRAQWERLLARLRRAPIAAPGGNGTRLVRQELSYSDLLVSQFEPMRAPVSWPLNAANIAAALRGDGSSLENGASGSLSPAGWGGASTSAAIQCADAPASKPPRAWPQVFAALQRAGVLQGAAHFTWAWAPCASWPVRGQDGYRGPWNARTPNPILLINERYDPNTGYANAVRAERYLGNAVLLTHQGYGHIFVQNRSACVEKAMTDYLTRLITPQRGAVCQSDSLPFAPDFRGP